MRAHSFISLATQQPRISSVPRARFSSPVQSARTWCAPPPRMVGFFGKRKMEVTCSWCCARTEYMRLALNVQKEAWCSTIPLAMSKARCRGGAPAREPRAALIVFSFAPVEAPYAWTYRATQPSISPQCARRARMGALFPMGTSSGDRGCVEGSFRSMATSA